MITQLTAEEIMNLPKNKIFWYGYIGFREKTFKCSSILKPVKIILRIETSNNDYYKTKLYFRRVSDGDLIECLRDCREITNPECKFYVRIFDTEEECKEYYNAQIHNTVDRLQHFYEEKLKYIKSKLI
jgi:hypothetical protein